MEKMKKSESEWREELSPEAFDVLRKGGTERPFTGALLENEGDGRYLCAGCGLELFRSEEKFHSGSGWPSFWAPAEPGNVEERQDLSHGMRRTEVRCARCEGHLGHLFPDGPRPTGLRYCVNSAALRFEPDEGGP